MSDFSRTGAASSSVIGDRDEQVDAMLLNRVSWGAIFAGVVVALVVQVLLTMLGVGIGAATIDPGTGDSPAASTFSIVAGIWYVISGIIAAFVGGYVAARMSGKTDATTGALHGLTAWAFATLVVIYLLSSGAGAIVGGAFSGLTNVVGGLSQTVTQTAGQVAEDVNPLDMIENQVSATGADPEALNAAAVNAIRALVTGDEAEADQARQQAAEALAAARGIPVDQATEQVQQIEERYQQAVERVQNRATQAADAAAAAVSTASIAAFIALVLGAIAGWLGGRSGVIHPVYADRVLPHRRTL